MLTPLSLLICIPWRIRFRFSKIIKMMNRKPVSGINALASARWPHPIPLKTFPEKVGPLANSVYITISKF